MYSGLDVTRQCRKLIDRLRDLADILSFYHAACNSSQCSLEKALCPCVCLSVCLSVKRMICDKTEERSVQIFIQYHLA